MKGIRSLLGIGYFDGSAFLSFYYLNHDHTQTHYTW